MTYTGADKALTYAYLYRIQYSYALQLSAHLFSTPLSSKGLASA